VTGPSSGDAALDRDPDDAVEFVVQLGASLVAASSPVTAVRDRIDDTARAYHLELDVYVLPTGVWAVGFEGAALVSLAATEPGTYRFDQTKALFDLVEAASTGDLDPVDGLTELADIRSMPPRFNRWVAVLGQVLIAIGVALVLRASWRDVAAAAALGALTGLLRLAVAGRGSVGSLLPAAAAFLVGYAALLMSHAGWIDEPIQVITPALVSFLPGSMLTIGAIELSDGSLAAGASRMVAGFYQLLILAFGLVVAGSAVGLTTADEITDPAVAGIGAWAPWVGVAIYVLGVGLAFSAPRRGWTGLFLVVYAAWGAQILAYPFVAGYVSALFGAAVGVLAASVGYRQLDGPPALVSFTPAFWLLVPGGVSLLGVTRATAGTTGGAEISDALFTIVAIALGVVAGLQVDRLVADKIRWW
jgi:uncharacterized membrane protein YjjP (DUF1212 family)